MNQPPQYSDYLEHSFPLSRAQPNIYQRLWVSPWRFASASDMTTNTFLRLLTTTIGPTREDGYTCRTTKEGNPQYIQIENTLQLMIKPNYVFTPGPVHPSISHQPRPGLHIHFFPLFIPTFFPPSTSPRPHLRTEWNFTTSADDRRKRSFLIRLEEGQLIHFLDMTR